MALSVWANITGLNHTLQQLIAQLALYKLGNPRESTQNREFKLFTLITGTELIYHVYSIQKQLTICTGIV